MVLALWQAVPVGTDEYGRTRIGIGAAAGRLEYSVLDCDGNVLESDLVGYQQVSAQVEHWLAPTQGLVRASAGYSWSDSLGMSGPFGALTISREGKHFGFGGGIALVHDYDWSDAVGPGGVELTPDRGVAVMPSVYLRFGNRDRIHVRTELFTPGPHTAFIPWRLMLGYNQFNQSRPSYGLGFGLIGSQDQVSGGVVAEGFWPVSRNAQAGFEGFVSPGDAQTQTGLSAQIRLRVK